MTELIIALDYGSRAEALDLVEVLGPHATHYKVGLELFSREGPGFVSELASMGHGVFLDLKLHDIPNTVAGAVRSAVDAGAHMLTVHVTGGQAMIEAAVTAAAGRLTILGVTILTSLDAAALSRVLGRSTADPGAEVVRLGAMAVEGGAPGIVCSAHEVRRVREALGPELLLVTPGIRLAGADRHDQARVMTPAAAVEQGSDYLVVGRAVTAANDPRSALAEIREQVSRAVAAAG